MSEHTPTRISEPALESYLYEKIPLTKAMGVKVLECGTRVVLAAPLAPNINHLGTAFGGSLHALPTLACYCALWIILRETGLDSYVVVKRSSANYRQPVAGELRAVCTRPAPRQTETFLTELRRHKKARLELTAVVDGANGKPAVEFNGSFVALG